MKWIKNRQIFLNEAKIRDVIFPRQVKEVTSVWGEKYLDYEEVTPTDKIEQGKWKLSEEDKNKVLGTFFQCDLQSVMDIFSKLPDKFAEVVEQSIDIDLITGEKHKVIATDFNFKKPSIDQIVIIYENIFRKINASETNATSMVQRDEKGKAVMDESGNVIRVEKEKGELVFANNLVNINTFITTYNACFPDAKVDEDTFKQRSIMNLRDLTTLNENEDYKIDFKIYDKDMYLKIDHNPKDILNMSISKFYSSCQHLYGGGYRQHVLGNVFDANSIPAFLIFETPIYWNKEIISEQLPVSRMMIRNIENFDSDSEPLLFFDRAYPDRMKDVFDEIIEKYTENKRGDRSKINTYYFMPDIDVNDEIRDPYMDRLNLKKLTYIGKNTKTLYLSKIGDWSKVKVDPNVKLKEVIIETSEIPESLLKINLNLDWIKFKYLNIKTLSNFDKLKTDSIAFEKCKFDTSILIDINNINPDIKKLQITSCDVTGKVDFSSFKNLEELQLIYTLDTIDEFFELTDNLTVKKLVISGDLIKNKECRNRLNAAKKRGIKIEIIGPVI